MTWNKLLSPVRFGLVGHSSPQIEDGRSPFQRDSDRLIFSPAFRRLQDKAQVYPLADDDYVRTRLPHSLEVSCVARSLGTLVGSAVCREVDLPKIHPSDFGAICAAAALAHDLGSTPFGHSGEEAIRDWFVNSPAAGPYRHCLRQEEQSDFSRFEANAQGLRLLLRSGDDGLHLTAATLAAFTKYPRTSALKKTGEAASEAKFGIMRSELETFRRIAAATGLVEKVPGEAWSRHPLTFLVEAADDISYSIVDIEDGFRVGILPYCEVKEWLMELIGDAEPVATSCGERFAVEKLRARAIHRLVDAVAEAFLANHAAILDGTFDQHLLNLTPQAGIVTHLGKVAEERIFLDPRVSASKAWGSQNLQSILDLTAATLAKQRNGDTLSTSQKQLWDLFPSYLLHAERAIPGDTYLRIQAITDFVASMTDTFAVNVHQALIRPVQTIAPSTWLSPIRRRRTSVIENSGGVAP